MLKNDLVKMAESFPMYSKLYASIRPESGLFNGLILGPLFWCGLNEEATRRKIAPSALLYWLSTMPSVACPVAVGVCSIFLYYPI